MDDLMESERAKYERVWEHQSYRKQADGDPVVDLAFEMMGCKAGESLIDWGCGKGTPAARMQAKGLIVVGFDIAKNCLDPGVKIPFLTRCLWDLPADGVSSDYAFCTDVLEHIPPERVEAVLDNICARTRKVAFLQVCTAPDISGPRMVPPVVLHLSVFPSEWWREKILQRWPKVEQFPGKKTRTCFVCFP